MIGRGFLRSKAAETSEVASYDTYELRLGDLMRGERATLGKSLLDVQRELKIKGAYIAAIEGADPSAFDTPGFIAGYVRSYARYLNMDPDWAFETFCRESGFATAHGMSSAASSLRGAREDASALDTLAASVPVRDIFSAAKAPFLPAPAGILATVEPRAVGSVLVLAALLGGLSYGGWMILREVQKVTLAPVEQSPTVVAEVDPLAGGANQLEAGEAQAAAALDMPSPEALDRLYRPEALEVPVLVPRDGPIAALDPATVGTVPAVPGVARPGGVELAEAAVPFSGSPVGVEEALAGVLGATAPTSGPPAGPAAPDPSEVRVTAGPAPGVQLVAVREAWVRVRAADGAVLFEGILSPGDTFDVPATEEPPTLRAGESGALYMAVNGVPYGPVGEAGTVTNDVALSADSIAQGYQVADLAQDADLAEYVAVASVATTEPAALPTGAVAPPPNGLSD